MPLNISFLNSNDKKRIKKNIYGNGFNFLLTILSQLFYIPIMLLSWGATQTGYWIFFIAIPSILSFWKLDFSEASRQELTLNKKKNPNVVYSISLIFTLLTVVIFGMIYFFINLNFLENFEAIKNHNITSLNIILILIFYGFSLELITNNHLILTQYKGKIYISEIIVGLYITLERILIPLIGFITINLLYAAIVYAIIKTLKFITVKFIINLSVNFKLNFFKITKKEIINIFIKSKNIYYYNISNIINVSGFTYFIAYFFSPEIITLVNALQTMFKFLVLRINRVFIDVFSFEFGNFYSKKKYSNIVNAYNFQKRYVYIFLLSFLIIGYFIGPYIFNYWTIDKFTEFHSIIVLVILECIFTMLAYNEILLGMALNKLKKITFYALVINILSFGCLLFFENLRSDLNNIYYILILKSSFIYLMNKNYNLKLINNLLVKKSI